MPSVSQFWFSTRLRLLAVAERREVFFRMDCVHVFRAADWDAAFQRAIQLGRGHEHEYANDAGRLVQWKLDAVLTLDMVNTDDLDGAEVYSEMDEVDPATYPPPQFAPERSTPTQSI